ncbi:NYN domain-containing protein [Novosphingobium sp. YJ-S2-02]|uniref:NYN domain-containing protein n=1 Tax=Novosphingobium aureum TaxID=2792964 RepID=A0A931HB90_9SPHN|nr:NYN domain-containing protein [Novosphingobium aureum]MBH0112637.1 NYN domain-containing protein [Novosphingobium aureum]
MANNHERIAKLAVLIDADNASPQIVAGLFDELASIGEASVRRIYGDFSGTRLRGWSEIMASRAIIPQQNFANTTGKNASDIALVIDAMDLLHTGRFDAFCIVSSDGDFTRLAARIREQGADVYGFGERKTPESFRKACKRFVYTDNLMKSQPAKAAEPSKVQSENSGEPRSPKQLPSDAVPLIRSALGQLEDLDGWYFLGAVGTRLAVLMPDFNSRTYGCAKLLTLLEKSDAFEIRRENLKVYVKPRRKVASKAA